MDGPDDTASFEIKNSQTSFCTKGGAADEAIDASIRTWTKEPTAVYYSTPTRNNQSRRRKQLLQRCFDGGSHVRGELECDTLLGQTVERAHRCGEVYERLAEVAESIEKAAELIDVGWVEHAREGTNLVAVGAYTGGGEMVWDQGSRRE